MAELRVGDRFRNSDESVVWEFSGTEWLCVGGTEDFYKMGDKIQYSKDADSNPHEDSYWTFIGNYHKSENFSSLYHILSEQL